MGKDWILRGPDEDVLSFEQVAKLFGYEPHSLRRLIAEGRFPAPRGVGARLYYTGDDVAAIRLLLGRWQPREEPETDADENDQNPPKSGRKRPKPPQDGDSEAKPT